MIGNGLVSVVETLSKRKFKDPDILTDMNRIQEVLHETIRNMCEHTNTDKQAASVHAAAEERLRCVVSHCCHCIRPSCCVRSGPRSRSTVWR